MDHRILGLSLGTRAVGLVVLYRDTLEEWLVKRFDGPWSAGKLKKICSMIEKHADRYQITAIAVKVPPEEKCPERLRQLKTAVKNLAARKRIHVIFRSYAEIRKRYELVERFKNKRQLFDCIARHYPDELERIYEKEKQKKAPYYEKLFEAAAAAHWAHCLERPLPVLRKIGALPNTLRRFRKLHGYTQREVGQMLGMRSGKKVGAWEKGLSSPPLKKAAELTVIYRAANPLQFYPGLYAAILRKYNLEEN